MKYKDLQASLNSHYEEMSRQAEEFIIQEAQKLMELHPNLTSFCIAMGGWSFYDENSTPINEEHFTYLRESNLCKFIDEWDKILGLTGNPIKIEDGKIIRNW